MKHRLTLVVALTITSGACIYDPDNRCSKGEVFDDTYLNCVCAENQGSDYRSDIVVADGDQDNPRTRDGCRVCQFNETLDDARDVCACNADSVVFPITGQCVPTYGTSCAADAQCAQLIAPGGRFLGGLCLTVPTSSVSSVSFCSTACDDSSPCPSGVGLTCHPQLMACVPAQGG